MSYSFATKHQYKKVQVMIFDTSISKYIKHKKYLHTYVIYMYVYMLYFIVSTNLRSYVKSQKLYLFWEKISKFPNSFRISFKPKSHVISP